MSNQKQNYIDPNAYIWKELKRELRQVNREIDKRVEKGKTAKNDRKYATLEAERQRIISAIA